MQHRSCSRSWRSQLDTRNAKESPAQLRHQLEGLTKGRFFALFAAPKLLEELAIAAGQQKAELLLSSASKVIFHFSS
ncbi:hypothetical protein [Ureibacillus sinduriensis]|uniref:Uncharacterized protein n=1 Tax=Ureibacillus sinduriensis BLB-1 = JCM 15800 TaxID=1384057 RepID=A0A0A3HN88_9BACL|nr:hypothetical protein [Ureibacillus sinduriensis]KGR73814.1 hypothetical protein CD33_17525 [Ureibacillus sinduriensis BLB-1 = JCM 15800]